MIRGSVRYLNTFISHFIDDASSHGTVVYGVALWTSNYIINYICNSTIRIIRHSFTYHCQTRGDSRSEGLSSAREHFFSAAKYFSG